MTDDDRKTNPGRFYGLGADGKMHDLGPTLDPHVGTAEVWICRRVRDYPLGPPSSAGIDACRVCGAAIAFDPRRPVNAPRVCMQCAGLRPLPYGE